MLYDTPGLIEPHYLLQEKMMRHADSALADADVVLMLVDSWKAARETPETATHVLGRIKAAGKKTILVLNKIDTVDDATLAMASEKLRSLHPFDVVVPISALHNDGTGALIEAMVRCLPIHPPYYPEDMLSEAPEKFFVSEIIREKIFELYSDEVPYSTTVDIVAFEERPAKKHFISADIIVERQSQKGIVIGKGGIALKRVGSAARMDIEKFLDHPVFLELHVKVREHWRKDQDWLRRYGYGD
ncbi:MAG: GTPase Era [Ignavibacteriales bacterium]|nr:GTPase Era [Ignavibacteriales bacterium]